MKITKKNFVQMAFFRGFLASYSGKKKKFYLKKQAKMDIHKVINSKI